MRALFAIFVFVEASGIAGMAQTRLSGSNGGTNGFISDGQSISVARGTIASIRILDWTIPRHTI